MEYTLLSHLSMQRQNYKIKVRICRIWEATAPFLKGDIFSLDCLLVDETGYSMQGTIRKQDTEDFKHQLTEGNAYIIEKFNVIQSKKRFIVVNRPYMIQISKWTSIALVEENTDSLPLYSFNFSSFSEVELKRNSDNILTDVIAQIVSIGEANQRYVQQTLTFIKNLEIQDLEGKQLSVTLWDKFASHFEGDDFHEKESQGPLIVILAGMTIRTFRDKIHLSTCSASKIYLNLEIPEVSSFWNSLHPIVKQIEWIPADNKQVISPQEEMCSNRKTVDELLSINSHDIADIKYTCEATIIDIDASHGWWYKACYYCRAAVKTSDDTICCQHCNQNDQSPIPWYKLNTIVEDGSGVACFTIFGRLAQELVHFPAQYLATMATSDKYSIPPLIKSIIGQKHIFQLMSDSQQFRTGLTSFRVAKIFTINYNVKGKRLARETLLIKNEEEIDPSVETSSSSNVSVENIVNPPQDSNSLGGKERRLENKTLFIKNEEKLNPSTKKTSRDNDSQISETSCDKICGDPESPPAKRHCPRAEPSD